MCQQKWKEHPAIAVNPSCTRSSDPHFILWRCKPPKMVKKILPIFMDWIWQIPYVIQFQMCNKLFPLIFHTFQWWHYKLGAILHNFSARIRVKLSFCTFLCIFSILNFLYTPAFALRDATEGSCCFCSFQIFHVKSPELWWTITYLFFFSLIDSLNDNTKLYECSLCNKK